MPAVLTPIVPDLSRERRASAALSVFCLALVALLPALTLWHWATVDARSLVASMAPSMQVETVFPDGVAPWQRMTGALVGLSQVALLAYGLLRARRCFGLFARGAFFDPRAVRDLRGFAGAIFASVAFGLLATPIQTVLLTMANPPGARVLTAEVSSDALVALLVAGGFWVVSALLARAGELAEENARFV